MIHLQAWQNTAALIGSRAIFGKSVNDISDFDYIFPKESKNGVIKILNKHDVQYETNNFGTIKIDVRVSGHAINFLFNIIFLDGRNFSAWLKATNLLKVIMRSELNFIKRDRLKMFNALVQEFGGDTITNMPSF